MKLRKTATSFVAIALVVGLGNVPAQAAPAYASQFTFASGNPTFDPYGSGTTLWGAVDVVGGGWLDFKGRSVVQTPDRPNLNPGLADFTFGARIALTRGVGDWNVMQKGYYDDRQWKLSVQALNGAAQVSCRVSGTSGAVFVATKAAVIMPGSQWHQVACHRSGNQVQVLVDGAVVANGTGAIGSVNSTKPYLVGSKGSGNLSDPDQYLGLVDDAFLQVDNGTTAPPPANVPPVASLRVVECGGLACTFDASQSRDPEGGALSFTWDFNDGQSAVVGTQVQQHVFSAPNTYTVSVVVRDAQGLSATASGSVTVGAPPTSAVAYRASAGAAVNATSVSMTVPSTVQAGDTLLLATAANRSDVTLSAPTGWTSLGAQGDSSMQSRMWVKAATANDAGTSVRVATSATTKMTAHLLAYSGLDPTNPAVAAVSTDEPSTTVAHKTPVATTLPQSWVLSYWADKTEGSTGWTTPSNLVRRQQQALTGGGRINSVIGDSGGPVATTPYPGLVATASQAGNKATMWSVVLNPKP